MDIPIYHIDAFSGRLFAGNPAAVCVLFAWLPDDVMQAIAAENNLSETAFIIGRDGKYAIRWLTPKVEVDLCGHATLASAFVIFEHLEPSCRRIVFDSRSGPLAATRDGELLALDFPARAAQPCDIPAELTAALGCRPVETLKGDDYLAVFDSENDVRAIAPQFDALARLSGVEGVIITAPGSEADFVSRYFAPAVGIPEDPVTGAAHCSLVPFWAKRLGKTQLHALQISTRGGELFCEHRGERVLLAGRAVQYLQGAIRIER